MQREWEKLAEMERHFEKQYYGKVIHLRVVNFPRPLLRETRDIQIVKQAPRFMFSAVSPDVLTAPPQHDAAVSLLQLSDWHA